VGNGNYKMIFTRLNKEFSRFEDMFFKKKAQVTFENVEYRKYTLTKAKKFSVKIGTKLFKKASKIIPAPQLFPTVNGSINIEWNEKGFELIITVPEKQGKNLKSYGKSKQNNDEIKLSFNLKEVPPELVDFIIRNS
jgi:hypothetical protein